MEIMICEHWFCKSDRLFFMSGVWKVWDVENQEYVDSLSNEVDEVYCAGCKQFTYAQVEENDG